MHVRRSVVGGGSSLLLALLVAVVAMPACRGCGRDAPPEVDAAPASAAGAAAGTDAGAGDGAIPYFPTRLSPDAAAGGVSVVDVDLLALRPEINACYRAAAKERPDLTGDVVFQVTIGPTGRVTDVAPLSDPTGNLTLPFLTCVLGVLKNGQFHPPPDGKQGKVNVPLSFHPPRDGGRRSTPDAAR